MANNVRLIDPIDSVSRIGINNGIPELEKFFVFAELTAERRKRSVITFNSNTSKSNIENIGNDVKINFIGNNYDETNPSYNNFSTSWTDSTSQSKNNEGFGMTNIDININSSYIPKVTIEFTDVRGYAFLNQGLDSPYSLLYDFPPPIFKLTLKGFYGKALEYELHLTKTNTKFNSDTGNFVITVDFVARTFAPLTDIPFKYIELFGLLNQSTEELEEETDGEDDVNPNAINLSNKKRPRNTYELLKKIERLYTEIIEINDTSEEKEAYENSRKELNAARVSISNLNSFDENLDGEFRDSAQIFSLNESTENDFPIKRNFDNIREYNQILVSEGTSSNKENIDDRLYIGIELNRSNTLFGGQVEVLPLLEGKSLRAENNLLSFIQNFRTNNESVIIDGSDFEISDIEHVDEETGEKILYKALDITIIYVKLFNLVNARVNDAETSFSNLEEKINQSVIEILGMKPTIYNVFEIICDDIDNFFNILRNTAILAEQHHKKYESLINDDINIKESDGGMISAFPLYISQTTTKCVTTQNKTVPIVLSNRVREAGGEPFPEITLVNRFVDAFVDKQLQELAEEMKVAEDADGNNKWIPFSPIDSALISGDYNSPYTDIQNTYSDVNQIQDKLYSKILERFYATSQFAYGLDFYGEKEFIKRSGAKFSIKRNDLITYLASAEASNIAESLTNLTLIDKMISDSKRFNKNFSGYLDYLQENVPLSTQVNSNVVTINEYDGVLVNNRTTGDNINYLYKNRLDDAYYGFKILDDIPEFRNSSESGDGIVDEFINNVAETNTNFISKLFQNLFSYIPRDNDLNLNKFTTENLTYFTDRRSDDTVSNLIRGSSSNNNTLPDSIYYTKFASVPDIIADSDNVGASNIVFNLIVYLSQYLDQAKDFFNDTEITDRVKAYQIVSLFGTARGFFSNKIISNGTTINSYFQFPSLIEVPYFALLNMGAMVEIHDDPLFSDEIIAANAKYNSLNVYSNNFENLFNEIDFFSQLNSISKNELSLEWNRFTDITNSGSLSYKRIISNLKQLLGNINTEIDDINIKYNFFTSNLQGGYKKTILEPLAKKYVVANFNQYTFSRENIDNTTYRSISELSTNETALNTNTKYFNTFFSVLENKLTQRKEEVENISENIFTGIDDNDITSKLYYSFKNISDKWIAGSGSKKGTGYPSNIGVNGRLIDRFSFVDRAMNPIGDDCVIGTDELVEMSKDFDISIFTVFSRLLAVNGFEFFPLQNFMSFSENDWRDTFATFETLTQTAQPSFVCMYVGGTSSNLQTQNGFDDDGIQDFDNAPTDFNGRDCSTTNLQNNAENDLKPREVLDKQNNPISYPYGEVRAFRVRYSEQNQSFFTDISLDSREYNETNESLAILSKIAKDESTTVPVPKGQNLYSTYENRAYTVKVTMLGNMMIQPTQYFQLENIPLYSGVYIILDVSHDLDDNNMIRTTFQGVRVLKYPNPIVRTFATRIGINAGDALDVSARPTRNEVLSSPQYESARKTAASITKTIDENENTTWHAETNERIERLHPKFKPIIYGFINGLDRDLNIKVRINSGYRTIQEQKKLISDYNEGLIAFKPAAPYSSTHNYALGIDIQYYDQNSNQFIESNNHDRWDEIGGYAEGLGLRWGIDFNDIIHFDMLNILSKNENDLYSNVFEGLEPTQIVSILKDRLIGGKSINGYVNLN